MAFSYIKTLQKNYDFKELNNKFSLKVGLIDKDSIEDLNYGDKCLGKALSLNDGYNDKNSIEKYLIDLKSSPKSQDLICVKDSKLIEILDDDIIEIEEYIPSDKCTSDSEDNYPLALLVDKINASKTRSSSLKNISNESFGSKKSHYDPESDIDFKLQTILANTIIPSLDDGKNLLSTTVGKKSRKCKKKLENIAPEDNNDQDDIIFQEIDIIALFVRFMGNNNRIHNIHIKTNERLENVLLKIYELEKSHLHEQNIISEEYDLHDTREALITKLCKNLKLLHKGEELPFFATPEQYKFKSGTLIECLFKSSNTNLGTLPGDIITKHSTSNSNANTNDPNVNIKLRIQYNSDLLAKVSTNGNIGNSPSSSLLELAAKTNFYDCIVDKDETLLGVIEKFCAELFLNPRQLRLRFDGEMLDLSLSARQLELEDQDTLDAILV